jgi:PAS domain S-box-containing protein
MIIQDSLGLEKTCESFTPSHAQLRTLIDTIPVIAWCIPADSSGEFYNRRWHDYTGLTLEASRDWGWTIAIHPDDLDELEKRWRADLTSVRAGSGETRLRRFDGKFRWFLFRYEPLLTYLQHLRPAPPGQRWTGHLQPHDAGAPFRTSDHLR